MRHWIYLGGLLAVSTYLMFLTQLKRLAPIAAGYLGILVFTGVILWLVLDYERELKINQSIAEAQADMKIAETVLDDYLGSALRTLAYLAQMPALRDGASQKPMDLERAKANFLLMARSRKHFDQLRFIDLSGMERIRVSEGEEDYVLDPVLQNKSGRYYMEAARKLEGEEVYLSPLDLNVEFGRVEQPLKPVLRLIRKVYADSGETLGYVVLNFKAEQMLKVIASSGLLLYDEDGYLMAGGDISRRWGAQMEHGWSLRESDPEDFAQMLESESSVVLGRQSIIVYEHFDYTVLEKHHHVATHLSSLQELICVREIPKTAMHAELESLRNRLLGFWFFMALVGFGVAAILARTRLRHEQAREAATQSGQRFARLVEKLPCIVYRCELDKDWTMRYISAAVENVSGYKPEEVVSNALIAYADIIHEADAALVEETVSDAVERAESFEIEYRIRRKDGAVRWVHERGSAIYDEEGIPVCLEGVVFDITQRKEDEGKLRESMLAAEQANRMKSEFLANMSHEIRTPMNAILGFTEILGKRLADSPHSPMLRSIQASGRTLISLLNDILDLSKVEAGKITLEYRPVRVKLIFDEMSMIFRSKLEAKGLDFHLEVDPLLPDCLVLDEVRLRQILLNLIGNAVKFTQKGGVSLIVERVGEYQQGSRVDLAIHVRDTGIGIPKDQHSIIFETFTQRPGQSNAEYGGTGLGLAICLRLAHMMNGQIKLRSELGKGSTFTLLLEAVDISFGTPADEPDLSTKDEYIVFEKASVLVVDDIQSNREMVHEYLKETSLEIHEADSGKIAVEKATTLKPDVLLMDVRMPGMDGAMCIREIRNIPGLEQVPAIVITASALPNVQAQARALANIYLHKPVRQQALLRALASLLPHRLESAQVRASESETTTEARREAVVNISDARDPDVLRKKLVALVSGRVDMLIQTVFVQEVNGFAEELHELGKQMESRSLMHFAETLRENAETYNIAMIRANLESLREVCA